MRDYIITTHIFVMKNRVVHFDTNTNLVENEEINVSRFLHGRKIHSYCYI